VKEMNADDRQYTQDAPTNLVFRMKRKLKSSSPGSNSSMFSCRESAATKPYATIPTNGREIPAE
jgi:hypothetical protein